jgi:hypothetical protein
MDRVLASIGERLACVASEMEEELARRQDTKIGMSLEGVAAGAELLGRPVPFRIIPVDGNRLAVRPEQVDLVLAIVDAAKKEIYFHGLSTVERIAALMSAKFPGRAARELVGRTLPLVQGFSWLKQGSGWFRLLPISKHGLPKTIDKILAVAGEVTVAQMRTALGRNRRLWKDPPPENVLLEFCRQTPGVRVAGEVTVGELRTAMARNRRLWKSTPPESVLLEFCRHMPDVRIDGNRIISDPPRDWRTSLTGVERRLVAVLAEHGPVMERGEMEDLCVAEGMNRFSFHAFVSWSPVIVQLGYSVYGLLGAQIPKRKLEAMAKARRAERTSRRVLAGHGWTEDGKVWLNYRLSKAASTYAVITVPAALKEHVRGHFTLKRPDGEPIGTLATKDGRAWGLGAFLRQQGARIDDTILLTLDLKDRTATIAWGTEAMGPNGSPS